MLVNGDGEALTGSIPTIAGMFHVDMTLNITVVGILFVRENLETTMAVFCIQ